MGLILRRLDPAQNRIFLTFDDGPDPLTTARVLDVLREHRVPATFFVIADRVAEFPQLIARIQNEGHAIGNHSLDHRYSAFFKSISGMRRWVQKSEDVFRQQGIQPVGFRPPAGIVTPVLKWVLKELGLPLVLWDLRFFDTNLPFSVNRARRAVRRLRPGALVLLHDRQKPERIDDFCQALSVWIQEVRARGLEFAALRPQDYDSAAGG